MKFKTGFFLLALSLLAAFQMTSSEVRAENKPVAVFDEIFPVPKTVRHNDGTVSAGVEKPFTIAHKSAVGLQLGTNKTKPALNVYLLDADNYSKFQTSGSLTNLATVDAFSKRGTLGFEAVNTLEPGKYVLIIRWAESGLFLSTPAVTLKLFTKELEPPAPKAAKPTPTPTGFWSNLFGKGKK